MVMIIAEAGVNHNGKIELAHKLVDAAAAAGADAVKFQTFDAERLDPPGERREMLRKLQLSKESHFILKAHAEAKGIEFISTPFDVESLEFLVTDLQIRRIKIASGNLDNKLLLRAAGQTALPIILSTGMATIDQVCIATEFFGFGKLTLLHCISAYPAPLAEANLRVMQTMAAQLPLPVGLSDHSQSDVPAIMAVALGATVIEKHLTLDHKIVGPDQDTSIDPTEFRIWVFRIRDAQAAMGSDRKWPQHSEVPAMEIARERKTWREQLS